MQQKFSSIPTVDHPISKSEKRMSAPDFFFKEDGGAAAGDDSLEKQKLKPAF